MLEKSDYLTDSGQVRAGVWDGTYTDGTPARVTASEIDGGAVLVLARDTSSVEGVLSTLRWTLLGVVLGGGLLALVLSRRIARAGLRPISRFAEEAEKIAETGSLNRHAFAHHRMGTARRQNSEDELMRLSRAFNSMAAALTDAQSEQRRLVADAGHELRTPLTSLRANIALLQRSRRFGRPLAQEVEERLLADLGTQAVELSVLIDDLAALASAEGTEQIMRAVRLDHVTEESIGRVQPRSTNHHFAIHLKPWTVMGDEAALQRAIVNMLDNAIKFSPGNSEIEIGLDQGILTIADRGVGVSAAEGEHAFHRFWRADAARTLPGSGLGLAIVAQVAAQHGGTATLESRSGGGAVAQLRLPCANDSQANDSHGSTSSDASMDGT